MPAYLFGLLGLLSVVGLVNMVMAGPDDDPRGPVAGWLHLGHQVLTTSFSLLMLLLVASFFPPEVIRSWLPAQEATP